MKLNLNADLGESFGVWKMGQDEAMLPLINTGNIACGFHAGDPLTMVETMRRAYKAGISVGAHVGFPDLLGFGRRQLVMEPRELAACITYQLGALMGTAKAAGMQVTHVKPHGAMAEMASQNLAMAWVITGAIRSIDPSLVLLAPVHSQLARAGQEAGLQVALEVYADRNYAEDGNLIPVNQAGALLTEVQACVKQIRTMLKLGGTKSVNGRVMKTPFHSIAIQTQGAEGVAIANAVRHDLLKAGHEFASLSDVLSDTTDRV